MFARPMRGGLPEGDKARVEGEDEEEIGEGVEIVERGENVTQLARPQITGEETPRKGSMLRGMLSERSGIEKAGCTMPRRDGTSTQKQQVKG